MTKLFTGLLQPTFQEGTGSFVSGDFNWQPFEEGTVLFMSAGPYGPRGVLFHFEGGEGVPKVFSRKIPQVRTKQ